MNNKIIIAFAASVIGAFVLGYLTGGLTVPAAQTVNKSLMVTVLYPDDSPVTSLEVDLWSSGSIQGPPNVGVSYTNASGVAVFYVPEGTYQVGFNLNNFPEGFNPRETSVLVTSEGGSITINLQSI